MPDLRLIDISALPRYMAQPKGGEGYMLVVPNTSLVNAPTVDAVPVVRCKDCVRAKPLSDAERRIFVDECMVCSMGRGESTLGYSIVEPEDFCSSGIRKED